MKWHVVLNAASNAAAAHPTLAAMFPVIRFRGEGKHEVPMLEHWKVTDSETELWDVTVVQWDIYCDTFDDMILAEQVLRNLFHVETQRDFGGMPMWSQYIGGDELSTPSRDQYFACAVRFEMKTLRERYEPAQSL